MGLIKTIINSIADPKYFLLLAVVSLIVVVWKRERIVSNTVGYGVMGVLSVFFIFGAVDPNFRLVVTEPDNLPIGGLIFMLVVFIWYSVRPGVVNGRPIRASVGPVAEEGAHPR